MNGTATRARAWCFTINNDSYEDLTNIINLKSRYLCFGFEIGKQGTEHIQGYVYFDNPRSFESVKSMLPTAHLEISRGTSKENALYTSKDGDWYEFGDRPLQGRASWEAIEDSMVNPTANPHLHNQYYKMYRRIKLSEIKNHDRTLYIISEDDMYDKANEYSAAGYTILINEESDHYDGQDIAFFTAYSTPTLVLSWINGYPPNIRRGYELIRFDPEIVFMVFSDEKEKNHLNKIYSKFIKRCTIDVDIQLLDHTDLDTQDDT